MWKWLACVLVLLPLDALAHVGVWGTNTYCDCVKDRDGSGNNVGAGCPAAQDGNGRPTACWANTSCRDAAGHSDPVSTVDGIPIDTARRKCEDWEAPTLRFRGTCSGDASKYCISDADCTGFGTCSAQWDNNTSAPLYGPPFATSGGSGFRGFGGYYLQTYPGSTGGHAQGWSNLTPATPTYGNTCNVTGIGDETCYFGVWSPGNPWQLSKPNGLAIFNTPYDNGVWNNEEATLPANGPLCPDASRGNCDDRQLGAYRIGPGQGSYFDSGLNFPEGGAVTRLGYTTIIGYSSTFQHSGATCDDATLDQCAIGGGWAAFKHMEWGPFQNFFMGAQRGSNTIAPMVGFFWRASGIGIDYQCSGAAASTGFVDCIPGNGGVLYFGALSGNYNRNTNFAWDTLHCVQVDSVYSTNPNQGGTHDGQVKMYLDGIKLVDATGIDTGGTSISTVSMDVYMNLNNNPCNISALGDSGGGTLCHTVDTAYRYEDNIHIRQGPPAPCPEMFLTAAPTPGITGGGNFSITDLSDRLEWWAAQAGQ